MGRAHSLSYDAARRIVLWVGIAVLTLIVGVLLIRGVDRVEVLGAVLFFPIFLGFISGGIRGGIIMALLASFAYLWLRSPAIDTLGLDRYLTLILGRGAAYLAFGVLGGWAFEELQASLKKLEMVDDIEDTTGLFNARSLVETIQLERARSRRYDKVFSLVTLDLPKAPFRRLARQERTDVLADVGTAVRDHVRNVDHPTYAEDTEWYRLAVVLPETGPEGAQVVAENLLDRLTIVLSEQGIQIDDAKTFSASHPRDERGVEAMTARFAGLVHAPGGGPNIQGPSEGPKR